MTLVTRATCDAPDAYALGIMQPAPRLPHRARFARAAGALSLAAHVALVVALALASAWPRPIPVVSVPSTRPTIPRPRLVFLQMPSPAGGGGGGGNRQPVVTAAPREAAPPREQPSARERVEPPIEHLALAVSAVDPDTALLTGPPAVSPTPAWPRGPGSGGGAGDGLGTGAGPGLGPGIGPGFGGGVGGGAYRPGGDVRPPTLLRQVLPKYTLAALERKIQGTVVLEVVVARDGMPAAIRVLRSLDPGLDAEAIAAVRQWHFAPGRLGDTPVDVLVSIWVDFHVL